MKTKVLSLGLLVLSWWSILCVPAVGCPSDPPPPVCEKPECQILVPGLGCVRNCLSNPWVCCYCTSSLCADDCSMNCCPDPDGWCPVVALFPPSPPITCVGCEVEFMTRLPFGCYCPSCCDYLGWAADPPWVVHAGGMCWVVVSWNTIGLKTVTAGLPCGSHDSVQVTIIELVSLLPDVGEEIDDGDGNPNTKSFVVCIADSGVVTVTATPNPVVSEPGGCWDLGGGTGASQLFRTVDRTTPGVTTITCVCGSSWKETKIYVYEAKLELHADEGEWWPPGDFWGHSWWVLSIDSGGAELIAFNSDPDIRSLIDYLGKAGWWPKEEPKLWGSYPGFVKWGDQYHIPTGSKDWRILFDSLISALQYVKALNTSGGVWSCWSNNCTDQAVLVGEAAGVETIDADDNPTLPSELSDWLNAH